MKMLQNHVSLLNGKAHAKDQLLLSKNKQTNKNRIRTGHGKPGKPRNFTISFSKPGKSWSLSVGHGK